MYQANVNYLNGISFYMLGSQSDGFQLKDSDVDHMLVNENYTVADISEVQNGRNFNLHLVYSSESSACVCLKYVRAPCDDNILDTLLTNIYRKSSIIYNNQLLISSKLFISNSTIIFNKSATGPSMEDVVSQQFDKTDNVFATQCKSWPIIANEW